ncbi:MAG TPA: hypothetical protein VGF62_07735 [Rhizomicrobium sp.]
MIATSKGRKAQSGKVGAGSPSDWATSKRAALGVRCHSGWAAAILACGKRDAVTVLQRRRWQLCDSAVEGAKQPFHHAEPLLLAAAEAFIDRCRESTERLAATVIAELKETAKTQNLALPTCSILSASGRKLLSLKDILASHALIHAAEGEFYRDAVAAACEGAGIAVLRAREAEALRQASDQIGLPESRLNARLIALGKALGPPWTADQKLATLGAWLALA